MKNYTKSFLLACLVLMPLASKAAILPYDQVGVTYSFLSMKAPDVMPRGFGVSVSKLIFLNQKRGGLAVKGGYASLSGTSTEHSSYGFSSKPSNTQNVEADEVTFTQNINRYYVEAEFFEPLTSSTDFLLGFGIQVKQASSTIEASMPNASDEKATYDTSSAEYADYQESQRELDKSYYYINLGLAQGLGSFGSLSAGLLSQDGFSINRMTYWASLLSHTQSAVDMKIDFQTKGDDRLLQFGVLMNF